MSWHCLPCRSPFAGPTTHELMSVSPIIIHPRGQGTRDFAGQLGPAMRAARRAAALLLLALVARDAPSAAALAVLTSWQANHSVLGIGEVHSGTQLVLTGPVSGPAAPLPCPALVCAFTASGMTNTDVIATSVNFGGVAGACEPGRGGTLVWVVGVSWATAWHGH